MKYMVKLKNISKNGAIIECEIYPEDGETPGHVSVNSMTEELVSYHLPPGYEWRKGHVMHARNALVGISKEKEIPNDKLVMWH